MIELLSRPAVATALGVDRSAIKILPGFPPPDGHLIGAGGRRTLGWLPATIEQWAETNSRPLNLSALEPQPQEES